MRLSRFSPPRILASGIIAGIVICLFIAIGYNLSSTTRFCAACHSMQSVAATWQVSTHKQFTCIECHLPDNHIISRVSYKAAVGIRDLVDETLGTYAVPVTISKSSAGIVNQNCLRCHFSVMEKTALSGRASNCINCHRFLVHGRGENGVETAS